jgi:hypothetical protein
MTNLRVGELLGEDLLCTTGDGLGGELTFELGGEEVANLEWERSSPPTARGEVFSDVWHLQGWGLRPLRIRVLTSTPEFPALLYAGGLRGGLARSRTGYAYEIRRNLRATEGSVTQIMDETGAEILKVTGRFGREVSGMALCISIADRLPSLADLPPLLLLWGLLALAQTKAPWLTFSSLGLRVPTIERAMEDLIRTQGV